MMYNAIGMCKDEYWSDFLEAIGKKLKGIPATTLKEVAQHVKTHWTTLYDTWEGSGRVGAFYVLCEIGKTFSDDDWEGMCCYLEREVE